MERTVNSDIRNVKESSTFKNFNIDFTYVVEAGKKKPISVNFSGNKPSDTPGLMSSENFNGFLSSNGKSINFNGQVEDSEISDAVFLECKAIIG